MSGLKLTGVDRTAEHFREIGDRATHQRPTLERVGTAAARRVTGIPRDTGRLAASIELLAATDHRATIGSRVEYAGFVFRGTQYMEARPPRVPAEQIAQLTARAMAQDIIR